MEIYPQTLRHLLNTSATSFRHFTAQGISSPARGLFTACPPSRNIYSLARSHSLSKHTSTILVTRNTPNSSKVSRNYTMEPKSSANPAIPGQSAASSNPTCPAPENAVPPSTHDHSNLPPVEASKRRAAYKAVEDHFDPSFKYVGIGSGSTVVYVVEAIAAKGREITSKMRFVPTGDQSKQLIIEAGLPLGSIDSLPPVSTEQLHLSGDAAYDLSTGLQDLGLKGKRESLDVAFDGADEIDEDLNCIKGGGACLFQEKLVATAAKKFICVAGQRNPHFPQIMQY
jgi:hypothetical protein